MVCQVNCLKTYGCGDPIEITQGAIYTPYMALEFNGAKITGGNQSTQPSNLAALTSLTYGFSTGTPGMGGEVEIIDNGGTMYRQIIQALNKSTVLLGKEIYNASIDFGWIITNCQGQTRLETAYGLTGKKIYCNLLGVEQTYEGGNVKLKVKLTMLPGKVPDIRLDATIGSEDNPIALKDALRILFTQYDPKFSDVRFMRADGSEFNFKNSDQGINGPKGAWPTSQQNPFAVARTWLQSITTDHDKGILITYDPDAVAVVFLEDPTKDNCCGGSFGTYIVNGGDCSPVLSFNTNISWPASMTPGSGAAAGGASSGKSDAEVKPTGNIEPGGSQTSPVPQQFEWQWRHPDDQATGAANGIAAHLQANVKYDGTPKPGFEAELKIIGDPEYIDGIQTIQNWLSIIYINPFYISPSGGNNNNKFYSWLTTSSCNAVLSNKKYKILGVSHQISGGAYVTTFKLFLDIPNRDIDANDALGGNGCGTEVFENSVAK